MPKRATPEKFQLDKLLKLFPGAKPREIQVEAIRRTADAYNQGAEYVVLEVPVGGGKSLIGATFALALGSSYILTLTEQLQEQYYKDFSKLDFNMLKGRGKFKCVPARATCAEGKHLYPSGCDGCPYLAARELALDSAHTVANYHSYYFNISTGFAAVKKGGRGRDEAPRDLHRPISILDEAHSSEEFLLEQVGVTVDMRKMGLVAPEPIPAVDSNDPTAYFEYIEKVLVPVVQREISRCVDPKGKDDLETLLGKLSSVLSKRDSEQWIPERGKDDGGHLNPDWFSLKPLTVKGYGRRLYGLGRRQLFMSGTILNAYQFVTGIGLDPAAGEHLAFDSPFPVANRPIKIIPLDQSYKARDETWPQMVGFIERILTHHGNDKGLLLCPSDKMLHYIKKALPMELSRRILIASGEDRMKNYNEHVNSRTATILGASGFWEGADLHGDRSRFQIIPAMPRPMWQGQIAARAQKDATWYRWRTMTKMLQGTGRSVRSEEDEAVTYILDAAWIAESKRSDTMIPKWVQDAVTVVGEKKAA